MRRVLLSPDYGALQMIPIPAVAIVLHPHLASVRVRKVRRYAVGDGGAESWTSPNLPAETFSPRHSIMDLPPLLDNKHWVPPRSSRLPPCCAKPAGRRGSRRPLRLQSASSTPTVISCEGSGGRARPNRSRIGRATTPRLDVFTLGGREVGLVGRVVGASFAVLEAEELIESGCRLIVSLTSAGQIVSAGPPPYFVIIDRALRDEGASYHYAPPSVFADGDPALVAAAAKSLSTLRQRCVVGASWTTDAPFRETAEAVEAARKKNILAVEMEASALYAFARTKDVCVLCLAHVTNTMGQAAIDFEKGEADGTADALIVLEKVVMALEEAESSQET
jgi:uridine phosphorylase